MTGGPDPDDDYQVLWGLVPTGDEAVLIGIPDMSPDQFEQQALARVKDQKDFQANVIRGLARYARYMKFTTMRQVTEFASTKVAPRLAVLGAIEDESLIDPHIYEAIETDITGGRDQ
jgi:hypothetical protein